MPDGEPRAPDRGDTDDPHRSRLRALKILFQADMRGRAPSSWLEKVGGDPEARTLLDQVDTDEAGVEPAVLDDFSRRLVRGVGGNLEEIDELLGRFSRRWPVHRMPLIDRNALRLGVYELLHENTPAPVVIDEAIELVKELSTDDSHRFVNGVLEAIRQWVEERPEGRDRNEVDRTDEPGGA